MVLVTSGAVAVGINKAGLSERPTDLRLKQALAAVGQCELMYLYDKLFSEYNNTVAQILLTRDVVEDPIRKQNTMQTFEKLFSLGIIPIINENDTVSTEELEFGDNDTLSAMVAELIGADLLVILSDIEGLYDADPRNNKQAKLIHTVENITPEIEDLAGGAGSDCGTGGMITKISAGKIATAAGINMFIVTSENPSLLYDILDGKQVGTLFVANKR